MVLQFNENCTIKYKGIMLRKIDVKKWDNSVQSIPTKCLRSMVSINNLCREL